MMQVKKNKPHTKEEIPKQLDLGIKDPFKNKILKVKSKTDAKILEFEVRKFLKDLFFWFVLTFNSVMLVQQGILVYQKSNLLPALVPILTYNLASKDKLISRDFLYIFPIVSFLSIITGIVVAMRFYNREKILTQLILLCTLLVCITNTIILIHLTLNY